jgi:DNA repair exonuclease SbcCD ATPase subunit
MDEHKEVIIQSLKDLKEINQKLTETQQDLAKLNEVMHKGNTIYMQDFKDYKDLKQTLDKLYKDRDNASTTIVGVLVIHYQDLARNMLYDLVSPVELSRALNAFDKVIV